MKAKKPTVTKNGKQSKSKVMEGGLFENCYSNFFDTQKGVDREVNNNYIKLTTIKELDDFTEIRNRLLSEQLLKYNTIHNDFRTFMLELQKKISTDQINVGNSKMTLSEIYDYMRNLNNTRFNCSPKIGLSYDDNHVKTVFKREVDKYYKLYKKKWDDDRFVIKTLIDQSRQSSQPKIATQSITRLNSPENAQQNIHQASSIPPQQNTLRNVQNPQPNTPKQANTKINNGKQTVPPTTQQNVSKNVQTNAISENVRAPNSPQQQNGQPNTQTQANAQLTPLQSVNTQTSPIPPLTYYKVPHDIITGANKNCDTIYNEHKINIKKEYSYEEIWKEEPLIPKITITLSTFEYVNNLLERVRIYCNNNRNYTQASKALRGLEQFYSLVIDEVAKIKKDRYFCNHKDIFDGISDLSFIKNDNILIRGNKFSEKLPSYLNYIEWYIKAAENLHDSIPVLAYDRFYMKPQYDKITIKGITDSTGGSTCGEVYSKQSVHRYIEKLNIPLRFMVYHYSMLKNALENTMSAVAGSKFDALMNNKKFALLLTLNMEFISWFGTDNEYKSKYAVEIEHMSPGYSNDPFFSIMDALVRSLPVYTDDAMLSSYETKALANFDASGLKVKPVFAQIIAYQPKFSTSDSRTECYRGEKFMNEYKASFLTSPPKQEQHGGALDIKATNFNQQLIALAIDFYPIFLHKYADIHIREKFAEVMKVIEDHAITAINGIDGSIQQAFARAIQQSTPQQQGQPQGQQQGQPQGQQQGQPQGLQQALTSTGGKGKKTKKGGNPSEQPGSPEAVPPLTIAEQVKKTLQTFNMSQLPLLEYELRENLGVRPAVHQTWKTMLKKFNAIVNNKKTISNQIPNEAKNVLTAFDCLTAFMDKLPGLTQQILNKIDTIFGKPENFYQENGTKLFTSMITRIREQFESQQKIFSQWGSTTYAANVKYYEPKTPMAKGGTGTGPQNAARPAVNGKNTTASTHVAVSQVPPGAAPVTNAGLIDMLEANFMKIAKDMIANFIVQDFMVRRMVLVDVMIHMLSTKFIDTYSTLISGHGLLDLSEITFDENIKLPDDLTLTIVKSYLKHRTPIYIMLVSSVKVSEAIDGIVNPIDNMEGLDFGNIKNEIVKIIGEDLETGFFGELQENIEKRTKSTPSGGAIKKLLKAAAKKPKTK